MSVDEIRELIRLNIDETFSQLKLTNIFYGKQNIDEDDIREVVKVLNSEYLTQGPIVRKFEDQLCKKVGSKFATVKNSATSALHISCMALDIGSQDIVWTSPNVLWHLLIVRFTVGRN